MISLCDINSRWRLRSAPTKSGWVPRLPRSWLVIIYVQRYGTEECSQAERYQRRQSKQEKMAWIGRRQDAPILVPIFHPALTKTNERATMLRHVLNAGGRAAVSASRPQRCVPLGVDDIMDASDGRSGERTRVETGVSP